MLVDFSRPVELDLREHDLRKVVGDVLTLSTAELSTHNVTLMSNLPSKPLVANVDADLLKQAVLNVIQNGAQAMPEGGKLEVILEEDRKTRNSCALPMRAPAFPMRSGRRSSTFTSPPKRRQRHWSCDDLPDSPVAPREHRSTIEVDTWHGVPVANSALRHGLGTPVSSTGGRRESRRGLRDEVACEDRCVGAAAVPGGVLPSQNAKAPPAARRASDPGCELPPPAQDPPPEVTIPTKQPLQIRSCRCNRPSRRPSTGSNQRQPLPISGLQRNTRGERHWPTLHSRSRRCAQSD